MCKNTIKYNISKKFVIIIKESLILLNENVIVFKEIIILLGRKYNIYEWKIIIILKKKV